MRPAFVVCLIGWILPAVAQQPKGDISPTQWQYAKEGDPLHAKVHDRFVLEGVYLTPPRIPTIAPKLVVECSAGKVEHNYFDVGAVVDRHGQNGLGHPIIAGLEARIDGKKAGIFVDNLSTDGQGLYFTRIDLKEILYAKRVIIGANEYMGPQVVMQFDMPDPSPVMEKCGADKILKRPDRINKKRKSQ